MPTQAHVVGMAEAQLHSGTVAVRHFTVTQDRCSPVLHGEVDDGGDLQEDNGERDEQGGARAHRAVLSIRKEKPPTAMVLVSRVMTPSKKRPTASQEAQSRSFMRLAAISQ